MHKIKHYEYEILDNISDISANDWNACAGKENPFIQYEFFYALESSLSACYQTGWQPHHLIKKKY